MSYCRQEGKDKIIFATKEDHEKPSKVDFGEIEEEGEGLILPNGDINWNCPCLGGMATGPCGVEFREAFSCFHYSESEPKGSDCLQPFRTMQECMVQYPTLYPTNDDNDDIDNSDPLPDVEEASESKKDVGQSSQSSDSEEGSSV
ncbi:mitochondrial intermembrane space import and assembly protein 40-B-like [Anneissia japonica]|uniref:mitochondrial intermembrane space import and assembly protein 40-B-like n=1 Tax=Anneissia japonica TaxID=1529436 RepID=UPI0014255C9A|nr:mitochondrial intermembrane space import and assembly protein 40-B-like [Anneissia japonica]